MAMETNSPKVEADSMVGESDSTAAEAESVANPAAVEAESVAVESDSTASEAESVAPESDSAEERRKIDREGDLKISVSSGKNKKYFIPRKVERENLALKALGRSAGRKTDLREENKEEDEKAKPEPLRTMEADKAETFVDYDGGAKNIFYPPESETLGSDFWEAFRSDMDDEVWDALQASLAKPKPESKGTFKELLLRTEELYKRMAEEEEAQEKAELEEIGSDYEALVAGEFRDDWNGLWSHSYGSFEDTTRIPAMRFTHKPAPMTGASPCDTLQVFSVKVSSTSGFLQWPLDVFGFIAIRDSIDRNRNIIFNRTREACQTLTEEDRNLVLVGPTRAVFVSPDHVTIEVDLKVKGTTESEDKDLSFLAVPLLTMSGYSILLHRSYTSKLSTVEFTLGHLVSSVEATIFFRFIRGSWPDGFRCEFSASGVGSKNIDGYENAPAGTVLGTGIVLEKIVLLDSRAEKVIVDSDGNIKLSWCVVSVETKGDLKVSAKAWKPDNDTVEKEEIFKPLLAGLSYGEIDIGFCEIEVSVAWSVISDHPVIAGAVV